VNLNAILKGIEAPPALDREALEADLPEVRRLHMFEEAARDRPDKQRKNKKEIVRLIKELHRRLEGQWWLHRFRSVMDEMLVEAGRELPVEAREGSAVQATVGRLREVFKKHIGHPGYTRNWVAGELSGAFLDFAVRALDGLEIRGKRGECISKETVARLPKRTKT
jgi:hypothetical protein